MASLTERIAKVVREAQGQDMEPVVVILGPASAWQLMGEMPDPVWPPVPVEKIYGIPVRVETDCHRDHLVCSSPGSPHDCVHVLWDL